MPAIRIHDLRKYFAVIILGAALVGFIAALLITNYFSQIELQKMGLEQLRSDTEKRAAAVSYFYSERTNDLQNLAGKREISIFFENKALEMSMEYGLRDSLLGIAKVFEGFLEDRQLGGDGIYTRIALVESNGEVLVDQSRKGSPEVPATELRRFLAPESREPRIIVDQEGAERRKIISLPYFFKGKYAGQLAAWISSATLDHHLLKATVGASQRVTAIIDNNGQPLYPPRGPHEEAAFAGLPSFSGPAAVEVHRFKSVRPDGARLEMIAERTPIKDTPFFLVTVAPAAEVLGQTSPGHLLLAMVVLSVTLLGGLAVIVRRDLRKKQQLEREIDQRRRAAEALAESEARFKFLFKYAPDNYFLLDGEGVLIDANKAAEEMVGYPRELTIGKDLMSLGIVEPHQQELARQLIAQVSQGQSIGPVEFTLARQDGGKVEVEVGAYPLNFQGQNLVFGIARDITERRRAAEALRKSQEQLYQAQKMEALGALAGGIAHDINNLLSPIVGFTELVIGRLPKDNRRREDLEQVLQAGLRIKELVQQILVFGRRTSPEHKSVRIGAAVKEAIKLLRASLPSTIQIRKDIRADSATVFANPTQINQVLMNLCTNASQTMRPLGGTLTIRLEEQQLGPGLANPHPDLEPGPYVALTVSDTGPGMTPEVQRRIFEPYFTTKPPGEGSGLGLAIVHGIVKDCRGEITVSSELGRGTTFQVLLPREGAAVKAKTAVSHPLPRGKERILLVDDEAMVAEVLQQMLQHLGYQVTATTSSQEALTFFRAQPEMFDLVLSDLTMPQMTGDRLSKELMAVRPDIPIILCTGYHDLMNEEQAKEMGIRALIIKPAVLQSLAETVREVLDEPGNGGDALRIS